ncbi:MAG: polymerase subunit sigma-24 [Herbinix sp.]|jgi:RNA polymerase sigma-70 factor (ECF subfamily)|nr:polymerase subunit sigma-24 [Herbinix sp.]
MLILFMDLIDNEEDKSKFFGVYQSYRYTMLYVANQVLHDKYLAEDAVQTAFLKIAKNIHKISEVNCPQTKSFVVIIVRNVALTMLKKENTVSKDTIEEDLPDDKDVEGNIIKSERMDCIVRCIKELPLLYRDTLTLRYLHEMHLKEISATLGLSIDLVKTRLKRGKKLLLEELEKVGITYE